MKMKFLLAFVTFLCATIMLFHKGHLCQASSDNGPIIHVPETSHAFAPVFEGEKLSHSFTVLNRGKTELEIKRVTSS